MTYGKIALIAVLAGVLGIGSAILGRQWLGGHEDFERPTSVNRDKEADRLDRLPEFRFPDIEGEEVDSNRWAGKVVLLNFWATWCPPCLRELPLFDELQRAHSEDQLQIVGVAIDDKPNVEAFLLEHPVGFPILLGDTEAIELSRRLGNRLQGLPFTAIFDQAGKLTYGRTGEMTRESLSERLEPLLSEVASTRMTGNLQEKE